MSGTNRSTNKAPVDPGPFPWWSKELLREQLAKGKLKSEIAEEWGCTVDTVARWIDKHGIEEGAA